MRQSCTAKKTPQKNLTVNPANNHSIIPPFRVSLKVQDFLPLSVRGGRYSNEARDMLLFPFPFPFGLPERQKKKCNFRKQMIFTQQPLEVTTSSLEGLVGFLRLGDK